MSAIILKELRENVVWAVLMMVGLGASLAGALYNDRLTGLSLVGPTLQLATLLGFPTVGFALGMLQVLQDRRRDRWRFIVHRPISRTRIFFGKAVAGLVLYMFATYVALIAVIVWTSVPGHVRGPFDWHMALPRCADLFAGLMWYVAGLLVAARKARWLGSRLLPLGLPFLASAFAYGPTLNLGEALAVPAAGILILLPAAWGAFIFGGEYETQPSLTRLLQGICMLPGIAIVLMPFSLLSETSSTYSRYVIDAKGKVLCVTYSPGNHKEAVDLQGNAVVADEMAQEIISLYPNGDLWRDENVYWRFQSPEHYLRRMDGGEIQWFYVQPKRIIEGFDGQNLVGSIGRDGFVPASQPPAPFPEPLIVQGYQILTTSTVAYRFDSAKRELKRVFVTTPEDPIMRADQFGATRPFPPGSESSILGWFVLTRSTVHGFNMDSEKCRIPLEANWQQYGRLEVASTAGGIFTVHYGFPKKPTVAFEKVVEVDRSGTIISRVTLPPIPRPIVHETEFPEKLRAVVIPPGFQFFLFYERGHIDLEGLLIAIAVGGAFAVVTLLLFQCYTARTAVKGWWMLLNLILGLAGILLLLSLRGREARVRCSSCGRRRTVSRARCKYCGAAFNAPPMEGIEIYEAA